MKKIDITDKLEMAGNTALVINGEEIEVKTDAKTALVLLGKIKTGELTFQNKDLNEVLDIILTPESVEKLSAMNPSFKDYATVSTCAIAAVTGELKQGEARTRTTT